MMRSIMEEMDEPRASSRRIRSACAHHMVVVVIELCWRSRHHPFCVQLQLWANVIHANPTRKIFHAPSIVVFFRDGGKCCCPSGICSSSSSCLKWMLNGRPYRCRDFQPIEKCLGQRSWLHRSRENFLFMSPTAAHGSLDRRQRYPL